MSSSRCFRTLTAIITPEDHQGSGPRRTDFDVSCDGHVLRPGDLQAAPVRRWTASARALGTCSDFCIICNDHVRISVLNKFCAAFSITCKLPAMFHRYRRFVSELRMLELLPPPKYVLNFTAI